MAEITLRQVSKKLTTAARNLTGTNLTSRDVAAIVATGILHDIMKKEADEIQGVVECLKNQAPSKSDNIGSKKTPKALTGAMRGTQSKKGVTDERRRLAKVLKMPKNG